MLMDALVRSLNIPTVNIGMKLGLTKVISVQQAMGWDKVSIPKVPSTLLGSYFISPYDVTASLPNHCERRSQHSVEYYQQRCIGDKAM